MAFMKVASVQIYKYTLALKQPLRVHEVEISHREGLMVHVASDEGAEGFGEIVPLAGWSPESLNEAYEQIQFLRSTLVGETIPGGIEKLDGKFQSWLEGIDLYPSVQFGIEMAVLNLIANARNKPLFKIISETGHEQIRVNALLQGTRYDIVQQAKKLKEEGFTTMKLKVGGLVEHSIAKVKAVNDVAQGRILLSLDANQSWSLEEAIQFGKAIDYGAVSYIEEPVKNVYHIPAFYKETMIPVALDESLLRFPLDELGAVEGVDVLVLKPTVLGGIEKTWQIMQQARGMGLQEVISSSFESGAGLLTLANLAGCTSRDYTAGLDTLKWFRQDLLKERLVMEGGKIDIGQRLVRREDLNFYFLTEVR
jgi:O-succinylbenzoate synthase